MISGLGLVGAKDNAEVSIAREKKPTNEACAARRRLEIDLFLVIFGTTLLEFSVWVKRAGS